MSDDTIRHDGGWSDRIGVVWRHSMLTDAEREAVETCIADDEAMTHHSRAATLRGLLERLGGGE